MNLPYYEIELPLPTSVNNMHTVGKGFRNKQTGRWEKGITRSAEYKNWLQFAAIDYRNRFVGGVQKFKGRIRVDYIFIWTENDKGKLSSDIANREKCLSDFLEEKLYKNDNQIDEQHHYRRIVPSGRSRVLARVYEIPDRRYDDPMLIFST